MRRGAIVLLIPLIFLTLACRTVTRVWQPEPDHTFPGAAEEASTRVASVGTALTPSPNVLPTDPASPTPPPTARPTSTATAAPTAEPSATPTDAPRLLPTLQPAPSPRQFRVFEELWQTVRDEYLYPDYNGLDWEAIYDEYAKRVEAGMTDEDFYEAMDEMIYRLGDDHSIFFSPEEAEATDAEYAGENDYVGIGVLTTALFERQRVIIVLVFPGSPAEEAGLKNHDSILAVDGEPILDEEGVRRNLLRGPEGTTIELTVQSPGEEPRTVTVTRRRIQGSIPVPYEVLQTPQGKRVGYLFLTTFNDITTAPQVGQALQAMNAEGPLEAIILDNRQNGGGASDVLEDTLSYFTSGLVGHFVDRRDEEPLRVFGQNVHGSQDLPLVVLVGPDTISFGEIFAGILRDMGRAHIIGEQTEGNVEILYVYEFFDGSRAWLAHDIFRPINDPDQDWEETGIIPDQSVPIEWDEVTLETDPAVQAALDYFDATAGE